MVHISKLGLVASQVHHIWFATSSGWHILWAKDNWYFPSWTNIIIHWQESSATNVCPNLRKSQPVQKVFMGKKPREWSLIKLIKNVLG